MRLTVILLTIAALSLTGAAFADEQLELGRAVFTQQSVPSCTVCHTLEDAGSAGQIGPNLDTMSPTMEQVYSAVTQGVGIMPSFSSSLTEEQSQAVSYYVSEITKQ